MLSDLVGAYEAAKAGIELARNALGAKVGREVDVALRGVNEDLLRLQTLALGFASEATRLNQMLDETQHRERALKAEIAKLHAFDAEKQEYVLDQVGPGAFAYRKTLPGDRGGAAPQGGPWFCAQCFDQHRKSLLQYAGYETAERVFKCHSCGSAIRVKGGENGVTLIPRNRSRHMF